MRSAQILEMRSLEDHHWWYVTLRTLVLRELAAEKPGNLNISDLGCGSGGMMALLDPAWNVIGIDLSPDAIRECTARGITKAFVGDIHATELMTSSMDVVLCLDVLYHQQVEDRRAMAEMARVLRPGGRVILNVAAWSALRGAHDDVVCGARRYNPDQLTSLAIRSGFMVEKMHSWNAAISPLVFLWRLFGRNGMGHRGDLFRLPTRINRWMANLARWDAQTCARFDIRWGTSLFAVLRRLDVNGNPRDNTTSKRDL